MINLRGCVIAAEKNRAPFVDQAISDLLEYTGASVAEDFSKTDKTVVLVGKTVIREAALKYPGLAGIEPDGLSGQGFLLQTISTSGQSFVLCCGGGPQGDAYAIIELIKAINKRGDSELIDKIALREEPFFIRRGVYAHQHWAYNYPYALRTWKFEDWKRYIDLLAYMKINFFQIWSMAGILPIPLSDGDREYLENYHKVIDYAKNRRGMEVFIGEAANNTAKDDGGVPVQQREYFDVETLKNPAVPEEFQDIMDNRRQQYKVADNADGYWVIDSDPGGMEESPVSEFTDILIGNRKLIDEETENGKDVKLAYWMWHGWGKGIPLAQRILKTKESLEDISKRLQEPWVVLACNEKHLEYVREAGFIDKTIFFPYNTIEREPSRPMTRLRFDEMYNLLSMATSGFGIRSAMGNAQTPLVQLPNIFFFAECAWRGLPSEFSESREALGRLAALIAPDTKNLLAVAWLALGSRSKELVFACASELDRISKKISAEDAGALGRFYFPDLSKLFADLSMMLVEHGKACRVIAALKNQTPENLFEKAVEDYAQTWFEWQSIHGYNGRIGYAPDSIEIARLWNEYKEKAEVDDFVDKMRDRFISQGRPEKAVDIFLTMFPREIRDEVRL